KNNIKIKGNVENNGEYDFSNGFTNVDKFEDVKFKVTNKGFELLKHKELTFDFSNDLVINRGNDAALLEGINLRYIEDNTKEDLSNVSMEIKDVNVSDVGVYNAKYILTDVWGRTLEKTRKVTVVERNSLEHNRIILKNSSNNENLMEFYIDTIKKRIIIRRFNSNYEGNVESLIKLTLYDESGRTKDSIEVTKDNIDSIKEKYIEYEYSDLIGLSVYDIKNGLIIEGNIQDKREEYLNGVDEKDNIENVRFKLIDESQGVKSIYNNAPTITIDGELTLFKDESPDLYKGVTAKDTDEHDKGVSASDIVIDTELDITRIGTYTATYILQDTWGRETTKTRKIVVKSSLLNNKIQFYKKDNSSNNVPNTPNGSGDKIDNGEEERDEIVELSKKEAINESESTQPNPNPDTDSDSDGEQDREEDDIPEDGEGSDKEDGKEDEKEDVKINSLFDISINLQEKKFIVTKNNETLKRVRKELSELLTRTANDEEIPTPDNGNGDQPSEEIPSQPDNDDGEEQPGDGNISDDDTDSSPGEDDSTDAVTKPGVGIVKPNIPIDGVEFEFKLFDENGNVKEKLSITTEDLASRSDINSKLNNFNGTEFEFGDYISIYAKQDTNNVRITGNIDKPNNIKEDYSTGISNPDYMYNVRFKINEDAMDAIYNEAPTIKISNPEAVIDVYCGDDIDYGQDAEISDDHDLDIGADNITISDTDKAKIGNLGKQEVDLILTDSWGRSVSVKRKYNVKPSIERNEIIFQGSTGSNFQDVFKLKFNHESKRFIVDVLSETQTFYNNVNWKYYSITVYNKDNSRKYNTIEFSGRETAQTAREKLDKLRNTTFEYGDYIQIYAFHPIRILINGTVRNQLEDYSDGANFGDNFKKTQFVITEKGLESRLVLDELTTDESLIEFLGTHGDIALKMKINHETRNVEFIDSEGYFYYDAENRNVFKITYYRKNSNGYSKNIYNIRGQSSREDIKRFKNGVFSNNQNKFNNDDYIMFEYIDIPETFIGLRINGKLVIDNNADDDLKNETFGSVVKNRNNINQVRFYLNKDGQPGIFPVRVEAAKITGADDIDVLQNERFNLKEHVEATDADGTVLTTDMTVTGDNTLARSVNDRWDLDTSRVGLYYAKYEVQNREGIKTTVYRNIRVYTNAELALKDSDEEIVMEQGAYPTVESKKEFLKKFAMAQDPEAIGDNAEQINQKLTERIDVDVSKIDIEKPGEYDITYSVINDYQKEVTLKAKVSVVRTINVSVPTTLPFQVVTNLLNTDDTTNTQDPFVSGVLKLKNNRTSDVRVSIKSFTKEDSSGELNIVNPNTVENWDTLSKEESMSKMSLGIFVNSGFKAETNTPGAGGDSNPGSGSESNPGAGDTDSGNGSTPGTSEPSTPSPDGSTSGGASSEDGASGGTGGGETEGDLGSSEDTNQDSTSRTANDVLNGRKVTWLVPNSTEETFMGTLPRASSLQTPSEGKLSFTSKHGKNFIGGTYKGKFKLVFKFE
ncbi:immunoglobulin-like domain-containing protein, partial [Clostridium sp.]|uniref:immunoglobulin-like domain-containing protein n=1 Tax=Clostridium sp. TaxID=1506 RepID=UPI0034528F8C